MLIVCADGSCSGNPGPGGWACEIWDGAVEEGCEVHAEEGGSPATTNNQMELRAAIVALEAIGQFALGPTEVLFRLDSQYVLKGMFEYLPGWKAKGWKTSSKKPVANAGMWQQLDALKTDLEARGWILKADWVKGHDGDIGNERVDTAALRQCKLAKEDGSTESGETAPPPPVSPDLPMPGTASFEPSPEQVRMLRKVLDRYADGDASVKEVHTELRALAPVLGLTG